MATEARTGMVQLRAMPTQNRWISAVSTGKNVKEDVEALLSRVRLEFDRNCCLGFDLFAEHFRDMKFALIFCGRQVRGGAFKLHAVSYITATVKLV